MEEKRGMGIGELTGPAAAGPRAPEALLLEDEAGADEEA